MSEVKGKVLLGVNAYNEDADVFLYIRNGGNILCVASPRYGKGALCKNIAVQVSKFKKICVFDYRGEWAGHVTKENPYSKFPDALSEYFVAENFAFPITEYNVEGDWIGFGFKSDMAYFMVEIIKSKYHQGDIERIREMIRELPINDDVIEQYNIKFGTKLNASIHRETKPALERRFEVVQHYFWHGKDDVRQVINFSEKWKKYQHLIIDLSDRRDGFKDPFKARAYAGVILRKMKPFFEETRGFYIFEEGSQLLANPTHIQHGLIVGVSELHNLVYNMVTLAPKQGVNVLILAQSKKQVFDLVIDYLPIMLIGRMIVDDTLTEQEKYLDSLITVLPNSLRREWWLVDNFYRTKVKFIAAMPRCEYETNI